MAVAEKHFRAMASDVHIIVVDGPPHALATARRAIEQLESCWSRFLESSDISRLNRAAGQPVTVDPFTLTLIAVMKDAWRMTAGRYDPSTLPALLTAGYVTIIDDATVCVPVPVPDPARYIGGTSLDHVTIDGDHRQVTLPAGMTIDAGGIGKGLAADLVVGELLAGGARGALVSIGGDLAAAGGAPHDDGWTLDIEDPFDPTTTIAHVMFSAGGVATSSTQSRRWRHANTDQHHLIDPATGTPSTSDLAAVTVIAPCGWHAEAHATALLLGGSAEFDSYTHRHGIEAIATTPHRTVIATAELGAQLPTPERTS